MPRRRPKVGHCLQDQAMQFRTSKTLALLGGVATLALGSTFMLRIPAPKPKTTQLPCRPRLLALEQAVCDSLPSLERSAPLAQLSASP